MLTFELKRDEQQLEIHGDKDGLLKLAKFIETLANKEKTNHVHLMTSDWGGNELSNEQQGFDNSLLHHVKIFKWA